MGTHPAHSTTMPTLHDYRGLEPEGQALLRSAVAKAPSLRDAAAELGISLRALHRWMRRYGVECPRPQQSRLPGKVTQNVTSGAAE